MKTQQERQVDEEAVQGKTNRHLAGQSLIQTDSDPEGTLFRRKVETEVKQERRPVKYVWLINSVTGGKTDRHMERPTGKHTNIQDRQPITAHPRSVHLEGPQPNMQQLGLAIGERCWATPPQYIHATLIFQNCFSLNLSSIQLLWSVSITRALKCLCR